MNSKLHRAVTDAERKFVLGVATADDLNVSPADSTPPLNVCPRSVAELY